MFIKYWSKYTRTEQWLKGLLWAITCNSENNYESRQVEIESGSEQPTKLSVRAAVNFLGWYCEYPLFIYLFIFSRHLINYIKIS